MNRAEGTSSIFLAGVRDIAPMLLAVGPFGSVAGLAAVASGLDFGEAVALSGLVNAGSSQLAALQLVKQGAPLVVVLATTFFVNLRFLMYSLALAPYVSSLPRHRRLIIGHMLVDQSFALAVRRYQEHPGEGHRFAYYMGLGLPAVVSWIGGTMVGAALGAQVPPSWSIDFTIPLIFLALLLPAIKDRPAAVAASTGGVVALLTLALPFNLGLLAGAFAGIAAGLMAERRWRA